ADEGAGTGDRPGRAATGRRRAGGGLVVRGVRACYKSRVPEDAVLLPPGQGDRIENPLGGEIVFKARAAQTAGALTVFEAVNPPGTGPPYHVHDSLDEVIYVLDGALRVRLADQLEEAGTGAFVFIPRGMPHTWEGRGDKPV